MIRLCDSTIYVIGPISGLNYYDTQSVDLARELDPLAAWNAIMDHPQRALKLAFWLRDAISSWFGVKRIGGFSGQKTDRVTVGDHLDFFLVEHIDETSLVLTERDSHLDVMTCVSTDGRTVCVTSSVLVHNLFGHLYMIPVGIAHRWIVRGMLRRLKQHSSA
ncbi:MAG: DUF2867 domain-containing protein [Sedimentitalea sp.]